MWNINFDLSIHCYNYPKRRYRTYPITKTIGTEHTMHRTEHIFPRNFSFLFSSSFPFFMRTIAATSDTSINTNKPIKNHQNNIIAGAFSIIHTSQVYNPIQRTNNFQKYLNYFSINAIIIIQREAPTPKVDAPSLDD